jgi:hypothetical protein
MKLTHTLKASLIVATLMALPLAQAATMAKADYKQGKSRISADYKTDKAACASLADNARDICIEEAKAKRDVARAELEYSYTGKPADATKVQVVKAESAYAVAKERCDDKVGNAKDVCVKEAKAVEVKALVDAKMVKKISEVKAEGSDAKRDADFKVATEKCDAMAGDAKAKCITAAKAQYGKN